jgi:hypothetical protein
LVERSFKLITDERDAAITVVREKARSRTTGPKPPTPEQTMKIGYYASLVATLAVATTTITALSEYAHADPPLLNAVPEATIPAAASPLSPLSSTMPNVASTDIGSSIRAPVPFEGGVRETLDQCMAYWDPGTHMSKVEWRQACQRTQDGTQF